MIGNVMDDTWIVAANAGRARIFAQEKPSDPLREVNDMVSPAARLRTAETEPERIGPIAAGKSAHNTGGALPTKNYQPPQTPEEHESELFARSVCAYLLQGYQERRFARFGLVASPQFLGLLRQLLDPQLAQLSAFEINKDYTQLSPQQLKEQLQASQARKEA